MAGQQYENNMVRLPREGRRGPGGVLMSEELVPGCNVFIMYFWIAKKPEPHPLHMSYEWHDYDEIIFNMGMDPSNPEYPGGETDGYMGHSQQIINKTTLLYIPRNVEHGRVKWTKFERPNIQMSVMVGTGGMK